MAILADCPSCHRKQANNNKKCKNCGEDLDQAKQSKRVKYWIKYRVLGKQRLEKVGYSIEDARDAEGKRRGQKRDGKFFEMMPESKITFNELTKWFLSVEENKLISGQITETYYKGQITRTKNFNAVFGNSIINETVPADLEVYKARRKKAGKSDSYVDQELGTVSSMIKTAFENEKASGRIYKIFHARKKLLKSKNANARDTILSYQQYLRLIDKLPKHAKPVVAIAFWTGMRFGEIKQLTWEMVDLKSRLIRLPAQMVKERKPKVIPISKSLQTVLTELPNRIRDTGKSNHVFLFGGKPIRSIRDGLTRSCKDAGIPYGRNAKDGFTFHDLRHTFATSARRAGIARNIIMVIMGHSDGSDMNLRYDRIDHADLIEAIDKLEKFLEPRKTSSSKKQKSDTN